MTIRHIKANTNPDAGLADRHRQRHRQNTLIHVIYIGFVNFVTLSVLTKMLLKNAFDIKKILVRFKFQLTK